MAHTDKTKREKERFVALSFCRADLLFELNDNREIEFVAGATPVLLGKDAQEMTTTPFSDYIHKEDVKLVNELLDTASNKGRLDDATLHLKGPKGLKLRVSLSGYRVPDFNNHFFLALKVDPHRGGFGKIEPLKREEETNLLETESFAQAASERVTSFIHAGGDAQVSMLKVNHLDKLLNTVGATDKQKLLGEIGSILSESSLGGDTASRIDDTSFSFAHASAVDTQAINEKIEALAAQIHPDGDMVQAISSTLDVDGAGMSEDQVARALIHTMQRFCENKGSVRENALSDVLSGMMTNTVKNVGFIKEVAKNVDFDIHFMPINDLKRGYVHHFEGLLRFKGERSKESPYHMICLAEEVGIICDLDMAVVKKSIERVHHFRQTHFLPPLAINLSGISLGNDKFMHTLYNMLKDSPEMSGHLLFEITESARIEDLPKVNRILQSIRKLDFEVCLDDFGAGAASFDYLNGLDVDVVKFDGPVVKRAYSTEKGNDLLRAMSNMCHDLNIHTVAEMVEDEAMAKHMQDCGIDFGQGWFFGKPDPDPIQYASKFAPTSKVHRK
ncbi:EAL domain-containing protein [Terasakiella sp.]|uniref:sensor domain-containing phosphodiesterase n=1 Tax=Terasakiella sp. TaxID=2034861 RepID=UPI003AA84225